MGATSGVAQGYTISRLAIALYDWLRRCRIGISWAHSDIGTITDHRKGIKHMALAEGNMQGPEFKILEEVTEASLCSLPRPRGL